MSDDPVALADLTTAACPVCRFPLVRLGMPADHLAKEQRRHDDRMHEIGMLLDKLDDADRIRDAALALSRAVEPADLPREARAALLLLRAELAASGVDVVGDSSAADSSG